MYPVMLSLRGRRCLVVGGGGVALRKVEGLLSEGAEFTVVATEPIGSLEHLAAKGEIRLEKRSYKKGEVDGYALGFAATDDREVNQQIYEDGEAARIWVNVADEPDLCSFHLPARLKRGAFLLVVASQGFLVSRKRPSGSCRVHRRKTAHESPATLPTTSSRKRVRREALSLLLAPDRETPDCSR